MTVLPATSGGGRSPRYARSRRCSSRRSFASIASMHSAGMFATSTTVVVEDAHAAGGDRAHGQLLVAGHAELAHEEHVERRVQRPGDLVADRHAAARQPEHDDVVAAGVVAQPLGQQPAGVRRSRKRCGSGRRSCHLVAALGRPGPASSPSPLRRASMSAASTASTAIASRPGSAGPPCGSPRRPAHSATCAARSGGRPPLRRRRRAEQHDRRRAERGREVRDAGVAARRRRPAAATAAASSSRSVRPGEHRVVRQPGGARHRAGERALVRAPVIATRRPAARSARATAAQRGRPAPRGARGAGVDRASPRAPPRARGARRGRSAGRPGRRGSRTPSSSRHQRATSCSPARHHAPGHRTPSRANAISRRGRAAQQRAWLCGPRPCRLTATSAPWSAGGTARAARCRPPRRPRRSAPRAARARAARRARGGGRERARSARSAGTAVSRSPRPSAR